LNWNFHKKLHKGYALQGVYITKFRKRSGALTFNKRDVTPCRAKNFETCVI